MSKKQFTLDSWLKDKSQKVVTRCGFPVRIVCTDVKRKDYPILALVERDDQEEYQSFTKDGRFSLYNHLHDNFDLFIETADEVSEDEKVRKEIINYFQCQSEEEPTRKEIHDKWIAWLENIPVTIDHEKREGFHLGYKAGLEKQGEQKFEMKTAEESLGIDSDTYNKIVDECIFGEQKPQRMISAEAKEAMYDKPAWSEEDEKMLDSICISINEESIAQGLRSRGYSYSIEDLTTIRSKQINWLKSLQDRVQPQPKQEWSEEDDDAWMNDIISKVENNLQLNKAEIDWLKSIRPQNNVTDEELAKAKKDAYNDALDKIEYHSGEPTFDDGWSAAIDYIRKKSLRPQNHWKPSELQLECLSDAIEYYNSFGYPAPKLKELLDDLKKLKEGKV